VSQNFDSLEKREDDVSVVELIFWLTSLLLLYNGRLRAHAMVSQIFDSPVGHATAILACESNFRLLSLTLYIARLTTLTHQIK